MHGAPTLTVQEAATRLGMTAQGVRKAVREGRLDGTTRLLPSGKREYSISPKAVDAYLARGDAPSSQTEMLELNLQLSTQAVQDKEKEIIALRLRLEATEKELARVKRAMRVFLDDGATQSESSPGGVG